MNPETAPPDYDSVPPEQKYAPGQGEPYNTSYDYQSPVPPANMYAAPPPVHAAAVPPYPYPNYQTPTTTVYVSPTAPTVITPGAPVSQPLGRYPAHLTCPKCSTQVQTRVDYQVSAATWLMCLIIFGIGCVGTLLFAIGFIMWIFCCVPCFINDCKDAVHTCPHCKAHIGVVQSVHL